MKSGYQSTSQVVWEWFTVLCLTNWWLLFVIYWFICIRHIIQDKKLFFLSHLIERKSNAFRPIQPIEHQNRRNHRKSKSCAHCWKYGNSLAHLFDKQFREILVTINCFHGIFIKWEWFFFALWCTVWKTENFTATQNFLCEIKSE